MEEIFGDVISSYSRKQAIEDGVLIDVSKMASEAHIKFPVAMTAAAYADCVTWTQNGIQDEEGRLWDVVWMLYNAIRSGGCGSVINYTLLRVPNKPRCQRPVMAHLKAVCGPGDDGEPVITIMLEHES